MTAGALTEACPKFAESQKLDPGAGTLLNLAACYERNGQSASAWATYTDAAVAAEKSNRADWATKARTKASAIQPTLSKLSIMVPHTSEVAGLEVKRDGALIGTGEWAVAIPVDPGPHVVEASAPNKKKWTTTVQVGTKKDQVAVTVPSLEDSGEAVAAVPGPAPVPAAAPANVKSPEKTEANDGSTQRTLGLAVVGVGVVGAALGTVFGLNATSKHSDAKASCNADQSSCTSVGAAQMKDARSAATLSTVAFIVGGAAIAGGAVIYLVAPKKERSSTLQALHVSPSGTGIVLGGAW